MGCIITFISILLITALCRNIARKAHVPSVVALIVAGLFMGLPVVRHVFICEQINFVVILGDIGLMVLMLLAGLDCSWRMLYQEKHDALVIALNSAIVPLIMGTMVFVLMGFDLRTSVVVGICLSITAEATKAQVLLETGKLDTRIGAAMIGAGIIDDTLGLLLFLGFSSVMKEADPHEMILITGTIASFFLGIYLQTLKPRYPGIFKRMDLFGQHFIIPFFFVSIGLHADLSSLILSPLLLIMIILTAFTGKFIGVFLAGLKLNFSRDQLILIGWGMNSRGAIELALALIAFRSGLLNVELYSGIIVMALVLTLLFPVIMIKMIQKNPGIMD